MVWLAAGKTHSGKTAERLLSKALSAGTVSAKRMTEEAEELGINVRTLRRTAEKMGVIREKSGMYGGWFWRLPDPEENNFTEGDSQLFSPSVFSGFLVLVLAEGSTRNEPRITGPADGWPDGQQAGPGWLLFPLASLCGRASSSPSLTGAPGDGRGTD